MGPPTNPGELAPQCGNVEGLLPPRGSTFPPHFALWRPFCPHKGSTFLHIFALWRATGPPEGLHISTLWRGGGGGLFPPRGVLIRAPGAASLSGTLRVSVFCFRCWSCAHLPLEWLHQAFRVDTFELKVRGSHGHTRRPLPEPITTSSWSRRQHLRGMVSPLCRRCLTRRGCWHRSPDKATTESDKTKKGPLACAPLGPRIFTMTRVGSG